MNELASIHYRHNVVTVSKAYKMCYAINKTFCRVVYLSDSKINGAGKL